MNFFPISFSEFCFIYSFARVYIKFLTFDIADFMVLHTNSRRWGARYWHYIRFQWITFWRAAATHVENAIERFCMSDWLSSWIHSFHLGGKLDDGLIKLKPSVYSNNPFLVYFVVDFLMELILLINYSRSFFPAFLPFSWLEWLGEKIRN